MTKQLGTASTTDDALFEEQANEVMGRLRDALADLIAALPGPDGAAVRRAADLQRALGINRTLAWQVHKVAHASDPLAEVNQVPKPVAMTRFFDAAKKVNGRSGDAITSAKAAFERFNHLVSAHAGSRSTFNSMVSGLKHEGLEEVDLTNRRAMFKGQSHFLGVEADTHIGCYIYKPSESDDRKIDAVGMRGLIGLRRFRRDVGWIVSSMRLTDDDGAIRKYSGPQPLVESKAHPNVGLLPKFCSEPLPELRYEQTPSGLIDVEVQPSGVGTKSAVTCLISHVFPGAFSRYRDEHNTYQHGQTRVRTPCKVLIQDTLVHRDLFDAPDPEVHIYTDHRDVDASIHGRDRDILPVRESVEFLGRGPAVLRTPDVPQYEQMARFVFDQLGWSANEFDVYRVRIEYPIMPASVVTRFRLDERLTG